MEKATVTHGQQTNETHGEQIWTYKNAATMDESIKHEEIESVEDTYIY